MTTTDNTPLTPTTLSSMEEIMAVSDNSDSEQQTPLGSQMGADENANIYILSKMALHPDDLVAFAKSQAHANAAYKKRQEKYYQTPVAARMVTGKNLQNFQPLAVRKAEFCWAIHRFRVGCKISNAADSKKAITPNENRDDRTLMDSTRGERRMPCHAFPRHRRFGIMSQLLWLNTLSRRYNTCGNLALTFYTLSRYFPKVLNPPIYIYFVLLVKFSTSICTFENKCFVFILSSMPSVSEYEWPS